jgi:hypothetical protein
MTVLDVVLTNRRSYNSFPPRKLLLLWSISKGCRKDEERVGWLQRVCIALGDGLGKARPLSDRYVTKVQLEPLSLKQKKGPTPTYLTIRSDNGVRVTPSSLPQGSHWQTCSAIHLAISLSGRQCQMANGQVANLRHVRVRLQRALKLQAFTGIWRYRAVKIYAMGAFAPALV